MVVQMFTTLTAGSTLVFSAPISTIRRRDRMTGIWSFSDSRWRPEEPVSFRQEKELHDLVEQAPELLPLAGPHAWSCWDEKCSAAKGMPISLR